MWMLLHLKMIVNRASTEHQQSVNRVSTERQQSINRALTERQQSVNDFGWCILYHSRAMLQLLLIIKVLASFIGNMVNVVVSIPKNECQQSVNRASTERQQSVNRASTERQQSVNRASTERQQSVNRASTERQQSINYFGCWISYNLRAVLQLLSIIEVLAAFIGIMVNVDIASRDNEGQQCVNRSPTERQ